MMIICLCRGNVAMWHTFIRLLLLRHLINCVDTQTLNVVAVDYYVQVEVQVGRRGRKKEKREKKSP